MPNPSGVNGFEGFGADQPYGAELKQHELARAIPVPSGGANAPQRAQRRAVRGRQEPPPPAPPEQRLASGEAQPPHPVWLAQAWQQVASEPGASELVRQQAAIAMQAAGIPGG